LQRSNKGLIVVIRSRRERMKHLADLRAQQRRLQDVGCCTMSVARCLLNNVRCVPSMHAAYTCRQWDTSRLSRVIHSKRRLALPSGVACESR
jgi:hypothetical protein